MDTTPAPPALPWPAVEREAPELAAAVAARFRAHRHHVLATVRRDGSPRLSGTEVVLGPEGLWLGMMPASRKRRDLQRDPRFALHSAPLELDLADGDAKLAGRAEEVTERDRKARALAPTGFDGDPDDAAVFHLQVTEVVLTRVSGDRLVLDTWHPGHGTRRFERS
jgi:hypothetical protein